MVPGQARGAGAGTFSDRYLWLLATRPEVVMQALDFIYRAISVNPICRTALTRAGAVTLIQRFASALNLKVHFDPLLLDGV